MSTDDDDRDRTHRRSRREIDRAIDDLDARPEPDRTESWRRCIGFDLDPDDPYHRRWIRAGADEPMTDEQARRAVERIAAKWEDGDADAEPAPETESEFGEVEQAAAERVRELDREREREDSDR